MDDRRPIRTDPWGSKVQQGPCAVIGAGPGFPPQKPPVIPFPGLKPDLNPKQVGIQPKSGSSPAAPAGISRPRPTALGTKPAPKVIGSSVEPRKEQRSVPPCIPGPQSPTVLPQTPGGQPYLSPGATLSPPPGNASPESSAQVQSDGSGETNDFR